MLAKSLKSFWKTNQCDFSPPGMEKFSLKAGSVFLSEAIYNSRKI